MSKSSKVLIIQTAFLGDAILITSLLEKIRNQSPETSIHLLVRKGYEEVFTAYTHVNLAHVWSYDKQHKWTSWLWLRRVLFQEKFDQVFVVQRFFGMGLLSLLLGANRVVGFDKNPWSFFFTEKVKHVFGSGQHEIARNSGLLETWLGPHLFKPFLNPSSISLPQPLVSKEYICISPGSVWETKRFPVAKWIEFIRLLPLNQAIVLMGSSNELDLSDEIEISFKGQGRLIYNETGRHALLVSTYIYQQSLMSFVNDSGPLHLCSAVNVPTVAVYCSTIPAFGFGPLADHKRIIEVGENLTCRPCGDHGKKSCPLGHFHCAQQIDVLFLLKAFNELSSGSK